MGVYESGLKSNGDKQQGETRYITRVGALQMQILERKVGEPEPEPEPADFEELVTD